MAPEGREELSQPGIQPELTNSVSEAVAPPTSPDQERTGLLTRFTKGLTSLLRKKKPEQPAQKVRDQMADLQAEKLNAQFGNLPEGSLDINPAEIDQQLETLRSQLPQEQKSEPLSQSTSAPSSQEKTPVSSGVDGKAA